MPHLFARFILAVSCCLFAACGSHNGGVPFLDPGPDSTGPSPYVTEDPDGPIPEPSIPQGLRAMAERDAAAVSAPPAPDAPAASPAPESGGEKSGRREAPRLRYTLEVKAETAPELETPFRNVSHLEQLEDKPPVSVMGLDQRMRSDLEAAGDVLHSFGYYSGKVSGAISERGAAEDTGREHGEADADKARSYVVTITFDPGPRYTVGTTRVSVTEPETLAADDAKRRAPATTLADVGLTSGSPAIAGDILDAVAAVRENFRDRGYPFATMESSRYIVDHAAKTLDVDVVINPGPLVYMDGLEIKGDSPVTKKYLEALTTWKPGWRWNQSRVEDFRNALRQSGLFSSAELAPAAKEDADGRRAVEVELTPAPPRTVGGAIKYDTDFGPGIQAYWENRNITGRGDTLRFEAPLWADLQEFVASYRLPFFLSNSQDLTARAAYHKEDTDAYDLTSYIASIGIERRFSRRWTGAVEFHLEGGELKDPDSSKTEYFMAGIPASIAYNNTNSLLDATRGVRLNLAVAPYTGQYHEDFSVVRTQAQAEAFLPVIGENSLVLALRGMYGALSDTNAQDVPASLRFYAGGGGSVRGYEYQSLGPRNSSRDPLGGASVVELSTEARVRFTETWGVVAFLDGGMAYEDATPDFSENDLRWGAGVGVRFYTAIGPIRFDFAVPLNPRGSDDSFQVYFSIGQSF